MNTLLQGMCQLVCVWSTYVDTFQARGAAPGAAQRVASAVLEFAPQHRVDPNLVVAIITVENPTLHAKAKSSRGAAGVMQVMPGWLRLRPDWAKACGKDLSNERTGVCWGVRILAMHLQEAKTERAALLAFNGCRSGTCKTYPALIARRRAVLVDRLGPPKS